MLNDIPQFEQFDRYPATQSVARAVARARPNHARFIEKSLASHEETERPLIEGLAQNIQQLVEPNFDRVLDSYFWLCDTIYQEQLLFYRTGRYRLGSFAEAEQLIYSDAEYMTRYLEGILLSQLLWENHAKAYLAHTRFLRDQPHGYRYLEIGPGHGLYLARAAVQAGCADLEAWDVSKASLAQTQHSLARMGVERPIRFQERDIQKGVAADAGDRFDAIVISEVLEHLDHPDLALQTLRSMLAPRGKIFINFPVNSPAPDHVYLIESIESLREFIEGTGLSITELAAFPVTGYSLKRAIAARATISGIVVAEQPQPSSETQ